MKCAETSIIYDVNKIEIYFRLGHYIHWMELKIFYMHVFAIFFHAVLFIYLKLRGKVRLCLD